MKALLQRLTETYAPSGYEDTIREIIRAEVQPLADEVRVDALGNLIARKAPSRTGRDAKCIMIAAHMDEIGLIASHVDENGFVRFAPLGGVMGRYLLGGRVRFLDGTQGLIGYDRLERFAETPGVEKMFIDVGATSRKDCPVRVGDVAAFDRTFQDLGGRVIAKSLDNRAGVLVAIETLRALKSTPYQVDFVFTTQEEVGSQGAMTAAYGLEPEIALAVDVTPTGDTPDALKHETALGKGPAIKFRDVMMLADPRIVGWMTKTAERERIPYQREVLTVGSTDGRTIQNSRAGVLTGALGIPVRYVHSPSEMVAMDDIANAIKLLTALLRGTIRLEMQ